MSAIVDEALKIVGSLLGLAISYGIVYLIPKLKAWLVGKIGAQNTAKLEGAIDTLVVAAEQMYKMDDPDGSIRNDYVKTELVKLGYLITNEVNAIIEAKVYSLPHGSDSNKGE